MMPQFQEYRQQVYDTYQEMRREGQLSIYLKNPTPRHLKEACLIALSSHYQKTDELILKGFFGDSQDYAILIRRFDIDKFKPLVNFLKGRTQNTDDKNVELLAWLIDYKERPYKFDYAPNQHQNTNLKDIPEAMLSTYSSEMKRHSNSEREQLLKSSQLHPIPMFFKRGLPWALGILIIVCSTLWYKNHQTSKNQCMYWAEDHFVSIPCDQQLPNVQAIALDTFRLHHQSKIIHPDTLSKEEMEGLWYDKINNEIEFFRLGGTHPEHPEKQLKPVTDYIIKKYIIDKK